MAAGLINPNRAIANPDPSIPVIIDWLALLRADERIISVILQRKEEMTFTASGSSLVTLSGGYSEPAGRVLRQDTAGACPSLVESRFHGHDALRFGGSQVMLDQGDKPTERFSEVILFEVDPATEVTQMTLSGFAGPPNHRIFVNPQAGTVAHQLRSGAQAQPYRDGLILGKLSAVGTSFDRTTGAVGIKLNDGPLSHRNDYGTFGAIASTTWFFGAGSSGATSPFTGWIGPRILANVDIYAAENADLLFIIQGYIRSAYGVETL